MSKKWLFVTLFAMMCIAAGAQAWLEDPRYGNSPEERRQNVLELNYFNDKYSLKEYDDAISYLQKLFKNAPQISENIYIKGADIYRNKILTASSEEQKQEMLNALMQVYDLRAQHFGNNANPARGKGYILTLKAREYMTHHPNDRQGIIKFSQEAIYTWSDNVDPEFLNIYFKEVVDTYKLMNAVEGDFVMDEYEKLEKILMTGSTPEKEDAKKVLESLLLDSGVADCDNLEKLFRPRLEAAPDDADLYAKAFAMLYRAKCDNAFILEVAEKSYAFQPTTNQAIYLAGKFEENQEFNKALKYMNEVLPSENEPIAKSNIYLRIAACELGLKNYRTAAVAAQQAIQLNANNGMAYKLLAQSYTIGSSGCSGYDRQTVYWLAYDMLLKAKNLLEDQSGIDSQLATYRANFPDKQELFFRSIEEGSGVNVNCGWVSGRTTARSSGR